MTTVYRMEANGPGLGCGWRADRGGACGGGPMAGPRAEPLHKRREPLALTLEILSPGQPKVGVGEPERAHGRHLS